ncbi:hypothetical protein T484DRAFT_1840209 [Baffinella frigidus]|nr:hypothetical protein T484DRAFT_1840209 [Cryptophyta sp. CCMP2293]
MPHLSIADVTAHAAQHYDHFGASVAISGDEIFVGAPNSGDLDQGAVFVFSRNYAWAVTGS